MGKIAKLAHESISFDSAIWYKIYCRCGCNQHVDIEFIEKKIIIEPETDDYPSFNIVFHATCFIPVSGYRFVKQLYHRFCICLEILFKGEFSMETEFDFEDSEQVDGLIQVLNSGKEYIREKTIDGSF